MMIYTPNQKNNNLFNRYEGEYKEDERSGQGTFWYPDGSVYEGTWAEGQRNGHGIYTYANGDKYEGYWKDGRKHGLGEYIYKERGIKYKGAYYVVPRRHNSTNNKRLSVYYLTIIRRRRSEYYTLNVCSRGKQLVLFSTFPFHPEDGQSKQTNNKQTH